MVWLLGFLVAHAVEIAAIGGAAYTVAQVEQVAVNTSVLVKEVKKQNEQVNNDKKE